MMYFEFNRVVALLLAIAVVSAACADDSDNSGGDPDAGPTDTLDDDAEQDATSDADRDADDTPAEIGEPCRRPDACVSGAACVGNESGEQFRCMRICDEAGRVCDDGSICTARLNAPPVCYTLGDVPEGGTCTVNLECTPGSLCFGSEPDQYCIRGCHPLDDACDDGEFCDANDQKGPCRSIVGADCDATADCRDDLICTTAQSDPLGSAFPDGYCTATGCSSDDDCPYESVCRTPPGTETAICMQTCETESDCRFNQGYTCLGPTDCGETNDRQACGDFVGSQRLCVPDAFKTAF